MTTRTASPFAKNRCRHASQKSVAHPVSRKRVTATAQASAGTSTTASRTNDAIPPKAVDPRRCANHGSNGRRPENGLNHVCRVLGEHDHKGHRALEVRDDVQVRGKKREEVHPPYARRRQEQCRQYDGVGRPDGRDAAVAGRRESEGDPEDRAGIIRGTHQHHARSQTERHAPRARVCRRGAIVRLVLEYADAHQPGEEDTRSADAAPPEGDAGAATAVSASSNGPSRAGGVTATDPWPLRRLSRPRLLTRCGSRGSNPEALRHRILGLLTRSAVATPIDTTRAATNELARRSTRLTAC